MDREEPEKGTGPLRHRLSPLIALLFLAIALIILDRLVTSYIGVTQLPGERPPDLQSRIDQARTEQARFIAESTNINITGTAVAAIATGRPFTETAYAPTRRANQTAYVVTQTAYAPTREAFQTAFIVTQTAYAPTLEAFQTVYIATQTAYAPTREVFLTSVVATSAAFQTAYASTARAKGTTTVKPPLVENMLRMSTRFLSDRFSAADLARGEAKDLDQGRYLFNAPAEMIAGTKYRVELRIIRDTQADSYLMSVSSFARNLQSQGTPQIERMQVGMLMKAKLIASDFAITLLDEEEQIILGENYTQWAWDVTPLRAGDLDLNLTISMKVIFAGEEGSYDHPVITKKIFVRVNPSYSLQAFARDNWQWLMGTIILPVLAWLWKKMRDQETGRKKKQASPKKTK